MAGGTGVVADIPGTPDIEDFQFELDGYRWGIHMPISTDADGFDPGSNDWITQDQTSDITGARLMGRDMRAAGDWSWMLHVDETDEASALEELRQMGMRWFGRSKGFQTARDVMELRYRVAGRTRLIYGRPGRFDYKPDNRLLGGYLPPSCTFRKADALHYDELENMAEQRLGAAATGGLQFPAAMPLTFNLDVDYVPPAAVVVGGDAPTSPVIEIWGPVTNPSVQIGTMRLDFTGSLPDLATITVDCRPWSFDIRRSGSPGSLNLASNARLRKMVFEPGAYDLLYTGTDESGLSRVRVFWRNAWHTF